MPRKPLGVIEITRKYLEVLQTTENYLGVLKSTSSNLKGTYLENYYSKMINT